MICSWRDTRLQNTGYAIKPTVCAITGAFATGFESKRNQKTLPYVTHHRIFPKILNQTNSCSKEQTKPKEIK